MKILSLQVSSQAGFMNAAGLIIFISLLASGSTGASAAQPLDDWQTKRLLHPTRIQRAHEQQGQVFIYDGVSDQEIEKAMDQNFERIGAMMFVHIKKVKTDHQRSLKENDSFEDEDDDDDC